MDRVQGIAVSTLGFALGPDRSMVVAPAPAFYAPIAQAPSRMSHTSATVDHRSSTTRPGHLQAAEPDIRDPRPLCCPAARTPQEHHHTNWLPDEPNNPGRTPRHRGSEATEMTRTENTPPDRRGQHEGGDTDAAHRTPRPQRPGRHRPALTSRVGRTTPSCGSPRARPTSSSPSPCADSARHGPQCLAGALDRQEPWGVWGGQLFIQGVVVARKRPRGRPRKNPVAA